jgi:hypothetical protein
MTVSVNRISPAVVLTICGTALFTICLPVQAVSITFSPNAQTSSQGSSVTFSGTIENIGSQTVFLNGDSISLLAPGVTADDSDFLFNAPPSLSPGGIWTGAIFQLDVGADTPPGAYNGSFTVIGGANSSTFDILGSGLFQLKVVSGSPVPDASSTWVLLLLALAATFGLRPLRRAAVPDSV